MRNIGKNVRAYIILLSCLIFTGTGCASNNHPKQSLLKNELMQLATVEGCRNALKQSDNAIIRRRAFTALLENVEIHKEIAKAGLKDRDSVIRRRAVFEYFSLNHENALPAFAGMVSETDPLVAGMLIKCLLRIKNDSATDLLKQFASNAPDTRLRQLAARNSSGFNFYRKNTRLKDNPSWDHDIMTVKAIPLPKQGWKFTTDPQETGHLRRFFQPVFDDYYWKVIGIGAWEKSGFPNYDGIGWYRLTFKMPAKIDCNAVELHFGAVDESAWVWLNGTYIGQHDIGPEGWDKSFYLDVSKEIKWNQENLLVVRVLDTAQAGGIWKPVSIEILK